MIFQTKNIETSILSKPGIQSVGNDWRRRYIQVANFSNFNAASNSIQNKLTNQEILGILKNRERDIKKWKTTKRNISISVFSYQIKNSLYQFFPKNGVMVVPFEIVFYNTTNLIEEKIAKQNEKFMDWNLQLEPNDFKDYFKMKESILSSLSNKDYEDILLHFHNQLLFNSKKTLRHVWYDIRYLNLKKFGEAQGQRPMIILGGYLYFWGELFFEDYIKTSEIKIEKGLARRDFILNFKNVLPLFLREMKGNVFYDWSIDKMNDWLIEENNFFDELFRKLLGIKDSWKKNGIKIYIRWENSFKEIHISFIGVFKNEIFL